MIDLSRGIFTRRPPGPSVAEEARRGLTHEQLIELYRFTTVESLFQRGEGPPGPLYAAVVTHAFCTCMLRIVARQREAETIVELDALDVTTLPLAHRGNDVELCGSRAAVDAVIRWALERCDVRVVVPRRPRELDVEIPAERAYQDVAIALGDGR